jgi:hypothetical protein
MPGALRRNGLDGTCFACVSKASRRDLLSVFPAVEPRAVTIPNMTWSRTATFRSRSCRGRFSTSSARVPIAKCRGGRPSCGSTPPLRRRHAGNEATSTTYWMVASFEPRKNHLGPLAAREQLRANGHPELRLVLVGAMGWDQATIVDCLLPWVGRGLAHMLDNVPASELRLPCSHDRVTVGPSFGEGFSSLGVEAMRCGGILAASGPLVHREICDASESFNARFRPRHGAGAGALHRCRGPAPPPAVGSAWQAGGHSLPAAERAAPLAELPNSLSRLTAGA